MRDEEIHIGDMVMVRDWRDLEGEYGTVMYGNIPLFHKCTIFSTDMKWLCGKILIVAGRYMGIGEAYGYFFWKMWMTISYVQICWSRVEEMDGLLLLVKKGNAFWWLR